MVEQTASQILMDRLRRRIRRIAQGSARTALYRVTVGLSCEVNWPKLETARRHPADYRLWIYCHDGKPFRMRLVSVLLGEFDHALDYDIDYSDEQFLVKFDAHIKWCHDKWLDIRRLRH